MRFTLDLNYPLKSVIPVNYQYPLSAAIYKVLKQADLKYADFLHAQGYGKGFKHFTFSDLNTPFRLQGDRMHLLSDKAILMVTIHMPETIQAFITGIFRDRTITIADKRDKTNFTIVMVQTMPDPLSSHKDDELMQIRLKPVSPVVTGIKNVAGNYTFLAPGDPRFTQALIYNWKNKVKSIEPGAADLDTLNIVTNDINKAKSRLITIKAGTPAETKVRGLSLIHI